MEYDGILNTEIKLIEVENLKTQIKIENVIKSQSKIIKNKFSVSRKNPLETEIKQINQGNNTLTEFTNNQDEINESFNFNSGRKD